MEDFKTGKIISNYTPADKGVNVFINPMQPNLFFDAFDSLGIFLGGIDVV